MDFNSMLTKLKRDAETSSGAAAKRARIMPKDEETSATSSPRRPFPTQKVKNVYLACPPNIQTGGPEAMHQLCHKINSLTPISAFMLYLEDRKARGLTHAMNAKPIKAYSIYSDIQVATSWDDDDIDLSDLVIWPEIWTDIMDTLHGNHQNAIWWLSVNNNNGKFKERHWKERSDILHLYQSHYAKSHIVNNIKEKEDLSKRVLPMTEFIPPRTITTNMDQELSGASSRDLQVVYNPFKGIHYTDDIIKRSEKKLKFTAIGAREKLTPEQVRDLLHRAKVYIDFGPHPGMDRLPREAAMAQCIVITNKDGAAFYDEDIPIPSPYKVGNFDVDHIHKLLVESVEKYDEKKKDFDSYRSWIADQEKNMDSCVEKLISSIHSNR